MFSPLTLNVDSEVLEGCLPEGAVLSKGWVLLLGMLLLISPWPHIAQATPAVSDSVINEMTLEEKVGQLMLVGVAATDVIESADAAALIRQMHVGGVVLLRRNIQTPIQLWQLTRELQELATDVPLFIAMDQEGGPVVRLANGATVLPGNMALGATRSRSLAFLAGRITGAELAAVGVNMNFAPVLDVNSNPQNPVIGVRSYGDEVGLVRELGAWYIRGLQSLGVVAVAKHFPGHGETMADSHSVLPTVNYDLKQLKKIALPPFQTAIISADLDAVMTAHVRYPSIDGVDAPPATMSSRILSKILRGDLGFQGLVITDDLEMAAIVKTVGMGQAAVGAISAGADMVTVLWRRRSKEEVYEALLEAVKTGVISKERLGQSVKRILTVKFRRGVLGRQVPPQKEMVAKIVGHPHHLRISQEIARRAITLVKGHFSVVTDLVRNQNGILVISAPGLFLDTVKKIAPQAQILTMPGHPTLSQQEELGHIVKKKIKDGKAIVVAATNTSQADFATKIVQETPNPVILVGLGSPFLVNAEFVDLYICAYSYRDVSKVAAARMIFGKEEPPGILPVDNDIVRSSDEVQLESGKR